MPKTPKDYDLYYSGLQIPSTNGIILDSWLVRPEPDCAYLKTGGKPKLAVISHPHGMSKYGYVSSYEAIHLNIDVELIKLMKVLTEDGYSVLSYDFREHGRTKSIVQSVQIRKAF